MADTIPASFALAIGAAETEADVMEQLEQWLPGLAEDERDIARSLASQQAALRRQIDEAGRLSMVDPLTGAANRRAFSGQGDLQIGHWKSDNAPFALGVLDLDRFKTVNDRFGHQVGDELLKLLVQTLQSQSRAGDVVARIGGEEFAVLIADATQDEAVAVFERIRATIAALSVTVGDKIVRVTTSIGVTTAGPDDTDVDDLFARADAALYDAKAAGRDRVVYRSSLRGAEIATDGE